MANVTITVSHVEQRPVKTRFGDKAVFTVIGNDGSKINFDFKNPRSVGVEDGGTYEVEVETDKYGLKLVKNTNPRMVSGGSVPLAVGTGVGVAPVAAPASPSTFPVDPVSPRQVEIRIAALNAAVRYWENRAIAASVDNKEQQEDVVKTAYQFADFISGQREVNSLTGMASEADASD